MDILEKNKRPAATNVSMHKLRYDEYIEWMKRTLC